MSRTLLLLGGLAVFGCSEGGHEGHRRDEHAHGDTEGEQQHAGEPGEKAGSHRDHEGEQVVRLAPDALAGSGIRSDTAAAGRLSDAFEVPAEIQLNPDRVAHISPVARGRLLSAHVSVGDMVQPKTRLARFSSVELGAARAEYRRTTILRKVARRNRNRQRRLRKEGISSERSLLDAELAFQQASAERDAARARLRIFGSAGGTGSNTHLESPIGGVVLERHATRGESISPDETLFVVADLDQVWVVGRVYEQHIAKVDRGMAATLVLNAYPGRTWRGTVDFVGATLEESTRTLSIRVEMSNPDGSLRPGLFGSLRLVPRQSEGTVAVVPIGAVQTVNTRTVVFTPGDQEGEFIARTVTVGRETRHHAEVLVGLQPGAQIVVAGAFVLKSELIRSELGHGHAH